MKKQMGIVLGLVGLLGFGFIGADNQGDATNTLIDQAIADAIQAGKELHTIVYVNDTDETAYIIHYIDPNKQGRFQGLYKEFDLAPHSFMVIKPSDFKQASEHPYASIEIPGKFSSGLPYRFYKLDSWTDYDDTPGYIVLISGKSSKRFGIGKPTTKYSVNTKRFVMDVTPPLE